MARPRVVGAGAAFLGQRPEPLGELAARAVAAPGGEERRELEVRRGAAARERLGEAQGQRRADEAAVAERREERRGVGDPGRRGAARRGAVLGVGRERPPELLQNRGPEVAAAADVDRGDAGRVGRY